MTADPQILIYRPGSLGDTIIAIPALYAIRAHFGRDTRITLLYDRGVGNKVLSQNLLGGHSTVDHFLSYPTATERWKRLAAFWDLFHTIREKSFDAVIYLGPAERSALAVKRDELFFRLAGIRKRVGFHVIPRNELYPVTASGEPATVPQESVFLLERLSHDGVATGGSPQNRIDLELTPEELLTVDQWLAARETGARSRPLVAFAPGVNQSANSWPIERFGELGKKLMTDLDFEPVVVGGMREVPLAATLLEKWGRGLSAAGLFTPRLTAALLTRCRLFVGLDSGPVHLASCAGIPIVALYSDRDNPGRWHPLSSRAVVLRNHVPCGACRRSVCTVEGHPCMTRTSVDDVYAAVIKIWKEVA